MLGLFIRHLIPEASEIPVNKNDYDVYRQVTAAYHRKIGYYMSVCL